MALYSKSLCATQYHNSLRIQAIVKKSEQFLLQLGIHIYEQIAARKNIDLGKRRMHYNVVLCKHNHFPYFSIDTISVICFYKKTIQAIR